MASEIELKLKATPDAASASKAGEKIGEAASEAAGKAATGADALKGIESALVALSAKIERAIVTASGKGKQALESLRESAAVTRDAIGKGAADFDLTPLLSAGAKLPARQLAELRDELEALRKLRESVGGAVEVEIKAKGADGLAQLERRLEGLKLARGIAEDIKALRRELGQLGDAGGDAGGRATAELEALAAILDGGRLDGRKLAELEKRLQAIAAAAAKSPKSLASIAPHLRRLIAETQRLRELTKADGAFWRGLADAGAAFGSSFGFHVNAASRALEGLLGRVKGIGAGTASAIGAAVAAFVAAAHKLADIAKAQKRYAEEQNTTALETARRDADTLKARADAKAETEYKVRKNAAERATATAQAQTLLNNAIRTLEAERKRIGVRNESKLYDINKEERENARADKMTEMTAAEEQSKALNAEGGKIASNITALEKQSAANERILETLKSSGKIAELQALAAKEADAGSIAKSIANWWDENFKGFFSGNHSPDFTASEAKQFLQRLVTVKGDAKQVIFDNENAKRLALSELANIESKIKENDILKRRLSLEMEILQTEGELADEQERRRRDEVNRRRQWAEEDRGRDERREAEEFEREKRTKYAGHDARLAEAQRLTDARREEKESAESNLADFNTRTEGRRESDLSSEEIAERDRLEARLTDARRRLLSAEREQWNLEMSGDERRNSFERDTRAGNNRLVALGIAGGGYDWQRETAQNTKMSAERLALLLREQKMIADMTLRTFKGVGHGTWGAVN